MQLKELIQAGLAFAAKSEFSAAERCFSDAIKVVGKSNGTKEGVRLLGHRARVRLAQEKYEAAFDDGRKGLQLDAQWVDGHRLIYQAHVGLERWSEARQECIAVLNLAPQDTIFQNHLQQLSLKAPLSKPLSSPANSFRDRMKTMMQAGVSKFEQNQFREAETTFTDALSALEKLNESENEEDSNLRVKFLGHRARCRLATQDLDAAACDARRGIAFQPKWTEGYRLLCRASMGRSRWFDALFACEHVLKLVPHDVAFAQHMEMIKPNCDDKSKSEGIDRLFAEGMELKNSKQFKVAEMVFSDALRLLAGARTKRATQLLGQRARCRLELGQFQATLEDAREGLSIRPEWIDGHRLCCHAYEGLRQWDKALDACVKVLKAAPQDVAFCKLHQLYRERSNVEDVAKAKEGARTQNQELTKEMVDTQPKRLLSVPTINASSSTTDTVKLRARDGSLVAHRYLASQTLVAQALTYLHEGELAKSFRSLREALKLWPQLDVPSQLVNDLLLVGPHDAVAWGGPVLFCCLQAKAAGFTDLTSERDFWSKRVERFPEEAPLRVVLAEVLYRCHDIKGSLDHMEKAIQLHGSVPIDWQYLRARCLPDDTDSVAVWLHGLFTRRSSRSQQREDELYSFVQSSSFDDEWMAHACYSLGVISLTKEDYSRAQQFRFLAETAESECHRLGLLPAIDENAFVDKKTLNAAFVGDSPVLSRSEQLHVVATALPDSRFCCGWCNEIISTAVAFVQHKGTECTKRPSSSFLRLN